jgi:hypothetical protein
VTTGVCEMAYPNRLLDDDEEAAVRDEAVVREYKCKVGFRMNRAFVR